MPSFEHSKVDPDRLKIMADNIEQSVLQLKKSFKSIDSELTNKLKVIWTGPASQEFFTQYDQDKELFDSHIKELTAFNDLLREATGIFDSADSRAQELVGQLKIG